MKKIFTFSRAFVVIGILIITTFAYQHIKNKINTCILDLKKHGFLGGLPVNKKNLVQSSLSCMQLDISLSCSNI